ncbi:hypothetical protein AB0I84_08850 [Streptomyces spectabilis]|uniref:hypothetical protein n=1 Tax=Streptomyces spectabilis TaxID=68270 RepID=UPI0033E04821
MRFSAPLTPAQAELLGEDVGVIVALAAQVINHTHGVDAEYLVTVFTDSNAVDVTAIRYLRHLEDGLTPGEAAARTATALVYDWAEAAREAPDAQPDA